MNSDNIVEGIFDKSASLESNHDISDNVVNIKGDKNKLDLFLNMNEFINNLDKSGINLEREDIDVINFFWRRSSTS